MNSQERRAMRAFGYGVLLSAAFWQDPARGQVLTAGTDPTMTLAGDPSAAYLIERDSVGPIQLGMARRTLLEDTYDQKLMNPLFMERHLNVVEVTLPVDLHGNERRSDASMVVHLEGNSRDHGTVGMIDVQDPRFRTAEGLGPASRLGDIRALHPDLAIAEEIIHESFEGAKAGDLAEVHHPYMVVGGVTFELCPANYLKYRPADGLPDDTPVCLVRISVHSKGSSQQ